MADNTAAAAGRGSGEFMLFGVRVVVDSMRKSVSLNDLSQYVQPQDNNSKDNNNNNNNKDDVAVTGGYASADDAVPQSTGGRTERKRGVPWTEEEHKLFLLGLQKVGKGDWRGISRNFVKSRTPTQVASHAQKYFLRRSNLNSRRRRSSLFDITTDSVAAIPMEEERSHSQDKRNNAVSQSHPLPPPLPETSNSINFPMMSTFPISNNPTVFTAPVESSNENMALGRGNQVVNPPMNLVRPIPILQSPRASTICDLNLNLTSTVDPPPLSLKLSLLSDQRESSSRHSAFQSTSGFNNGESIIIVA